MGSFGQGYFGDGTFGYTELTLVSQRPIQKFYYTRELPPHAVAIAQVMTPEMTPGQLVDVANTPYLPASLGVWKASGTLAPIADFIAPDLNQSIAISGSTLYQVDNQFFELTGHVDAAGTPLFYYHALPPKVSDVRILDMDGNIVTGPTLLDGLLLYHNQDGAPYRVRFADQSGVVRTQLLHYTPALGLAVSAPSATTYVFSGRTIEVLTPGIYYIRFVDSCGYQVEVPYSQPSNLPWFPRVRSALQPPAPEWARQGFLPVRPYLLATWISGKVVAPNLIEFDRKQVYYDPKHLPDVLVFDKNNQFKFALEGTAPGTPHRRGTLYAWKRGLVSGVDPYQARVEVAVELASDDLVFGFYSYREQDVIYTDLDVNPFTNPAIKNRTVKFYYRVDSDPFQVLYHQVFDAGLPVFGLTNDPNLFDWSNPPATVHVFAQMIVGATIGTSEFTVTDARVRGGGLAPEFQAIPEAANFWDLGNLDGKPYPTAGALAVYLPSSILDVMSKADVEAHVNASLPLGTYPVVRYYDPVTYEESV